MINPTNGFDVALVTTALQNRLAWRSLGQTSDSGRYFDDGSFHAVCNSTYLRNLQSNPDMTDSDYATWLSNFTNSVILSTVNSVLNKPQVIDKTQLIFNRIDRLFYRTIQSQSAFVGISFILGDGSYAVQVNNLALFFNKSINVPLYLYNDFQLQPVWTGTVQATAYSQTIVNMADNVILNYLTPNIAKGGRWYLGYYQSDIDAQGAQALYYNVQYAAFKKFAVSSFQASVVPAPDGSGIPDFNRTTVTNNYLIYGLNAEVTTYRDYTNAIVQAPHLFDELIGLQVAAAIIEQTLFSTRSNNTQGKLQSEQDLGMLYRDLNGAYTEQGKAITLGLKNRIDREVVRVKKEFQPYHKTQIGMA